MNMENKSDQKQSINFLRGVPAEVALSHIVSQVAEGYEKVIRKYGTDVLQYGHFTGFKPLREQLGKLYNVSPERVVIGNGGLEIISLFFKNTIILYKPFMFPDPSRSSNCII